MMRLHRGDLWSPQIPVKNAISFATECVSNLRPGYSFVMQVHIPLPSGPESAGLARDAVRRTLRDWDHDEALDDLLIVVSELVTNAFRYGRAPVVLHLAIEDGHLVVGVQDSEPTALPIPQKADDSRPSGRGLRLVTAMTTHWGWKREAENKVVWAQLPLVG